MSLESLMFFNLNVASIGRKLHGFEIKCFCNVRYCASLKNSFNLSPKTRLLLLLYRSAVFLCGCILTQLGKNSNTVLSQTGDTCLNTTCALLFLILFILSFDAFLSAVANTSLLHSTISDNVMSPKGKCNLVELFSSCS